MFRPPDSGAANEHRSGEHLAGRTVVVVVTQLKIVRVGDAEESTINAPVGVDVFHYTIAGHAGTGMFGTLFVVAEATPTPS